MKIMRVNITNQQEDPEGYNAWVISFIGQQKQKLPEKIKGMLFNNEKSIIDSYKG